MLGQGRDAKAGHSSWAASSPGTNHGCDSGIACAHGRSRSASGAPDFRLVVAPSNTSTEIGALLPSRVSTLVCTSDQHGGNLRKVAITVPWGELTAGLQRIQSVGDR